MLAEGGAKPYLPMEGSAAMRSAVQALLFGADHPAVEQPAAWPRIQTVGSSGGLQVGADFHQALAARQRAVGERPDLGQPPRRCSKARAVQVNTYPYYDAATGGLRFEAMLEALRPAARAQRRAAARLLPQPHGRGPVAGSVGRS
jgi:aromatic-amino-acid transaminase